MSFRGFLLILLISYIISISLHWMYTGIPPNNVESLTLGVLVCSNIMVIKWSIIGYKMLLRAHEVVENWLVVMSKKIFGNFAYQGGVLNKGSTNYLLSTSMSLPFVKESSSKVRIFHDKSKYYFKNLHKRGSVKPTVAALSTLTDVSQQQLWLQEIPTDELLMWLWQIGVSNANDIHIKQQPFVRFALRELCNRARSERAVYASSLNNELKRRAREEQYHVLHQDVSPSFEGQESFECLNVNQKPIVRYA